MFSRLMLTAAATAGLALPALADTRAVQSQAIAPAPRSTHAATDVKPGMTAATPAKPALAAPATAAPVTVAPATKPSTVTAAPAVPGTVRSN